MDTDQLLTEAELAERLRVRASTLRTWRYRGAGPRFVKLGADERSPVRYHWPDVQHWLETHTCTPE